MTSYVEARESLVSAFHTAWATAYPGVKIFYENTTQIDLDTVGPVFVTVYVNFTDGVRMELDPQPTSKTWGEVTFRVFSKEGQGTKTALQMFDFLTALMKYKQFGGVTTEFPVPGPKQSAKGWASFDLDVPFFFYQ